MASYGCTVCSASMALAAYGIEIDPGELNRRLRSEAGFTRSGLLIWASLAEIAGPRFDVVVRDRFGHGELDDSLMAGDPVIAKVLYGGSIWHWVLVVGKRDLDYLILDPLSTAEAPTPARDLYPDGFYAMRHLTRG